MLETCTIHMISKSIKISLTSNYGSQCTISWTVLYVFMFSITDVVTSINWIDWCSIKCWFNCWVKWNWIPLTQGHSHVCRVMSINQSSKISKFNNAVQMIFFIPKNNRHQKLQCNMAMALDYILDIFFHTFQQFSFSVWELGNLLHKQMFYFGYFWKLLPLEKEILGLHLQMSPNALIFLNSGCHLRLFIDSSKISQFPIIS